ncbi:hypothetical protein OG625_13875 [Streptomyces sp. NBC_01351]|uniref:hypothetical protein n=1 Tax=Streptomyces sp. NBC_01351 TaxID=2903833 RepID=UPI002E335EFE|nr:hypothetical protein [Streptomyces sp. NBC_01351]
MSEQQAVSRAEEIIRQAVAGMSPQPTPERGGPHGPGACLSEFGSTKRAQVHFSYQLKGVPGSAAKGLLRQARDAWVEQGYEFQGKKGDGDWTEPDPSLFMSTGRDDFSMSGGVGITNVSTGEGIAYITVNSPCYPRPEPSASSSSAASSEAGRPSPHRTSGNDPAQYWESFRRRGDA